mmetsp:Transcript_36174/g.84723  ORF Transcript_36174/g.84723 Transcript_36174/m.84723 type:complete len:232 (+) Transcript_36174:535-1230(+)
MCQQCKDCRCPIRPVAFRCHFHQVPFGSAAGTSKRIAEKLYLLHSVERGYSSGLAQLGVVDIMQNSRKSLGHVRGASTPTVSIQDANEKAHVCHISSREMALVFGAASLLVHTHGQSLLNAFTRAYGNALPAIFPSHRHTAHPSAMHQTAGGQRNHVSIQGAANGYGHLDAVIRQDFANLAPAAVPQHYATSAGRIAGVLRGRGILGLYGLVPLCQTLCRCCCCSLHADAS